MKTFFLVLISCLISSSAFAQAEVYKTIRHGDPYHPKADSFQVKAPGFSAISYEDGQILGSTDNREFSIRLPIPNKSLKDNARWENAYLADLAWVELDSIHVLFYEESISTHSSFHFAILNKENYKIKHIEGGAVNNITSSNFREGYIYLTGFGKVGKYNLSNRKYAWEHNGLYRKYSTFNSIEGPKFINGYVLYTSDSEAPRSNRIDSLLVNDEDGSIQLLTTK